jgi:hypothetical protein
MVSSNFIILKQRSHLSHPKSDRTSHILKAIALSHPQKSDRPSTSPKQRSHLPHFPKSDRPPIIPKSDRTSTPQKAIAPLTSQKAIPSVRFATPSYIPKKRLLGRASLSQ